MKKTLQYMLTPEFHGLVRSVEALQEYQVLVVFVQKAGINVIEVVKQFHKVIDMEEYVPSKLESLLTYTTRLQKVGDGMKKLLEDLWAVLALDKIDALYKEKINTSEVFAEFIAKMSSPELQKIITNLYEHSTYKDALAKTRAKGLEFEGFTKLGSRIFGLEFPKIKLATF